MKKFFAFAIALTLALTGARADDVITIAVNAASGTWTATNAGGTWARAWASKATDPQLTLTTGQNNMMNYGGTDDIQFYTGAGKSCNYTMTVSNGYIITGYSFDFTNSDATVDMTVTPSSGGSAVTCNGEATARLEVSAITLQSTSFNVKASAAKFVNTKNFVVTVERSKVPLEPLQELFVTPAGATIPYRIPALVQTRSGNLVAIADYRYCGTDIGFGRVDLVARISQDNGQTWGKEFVVVSGTGTTGAWDCGFGDAAAVADLESDTILLVCVCGNTVYGASTTTRENPNRIARFYSTDGGLTWSKPEEITESIYKLFDADTAGVVQSMFVGSGKIFQSRRIKVGTHYRIYAALCARPNGNRVIYSDDLGRTWKILGSVTDHPVPNGDEPKCVELPDGNVLLSSRANNGRLFNVYKYSNAAKATGLWTGVASSTPNNGGILAANNSCNGGVLVLPVTRTADNEEMFLLLQSVPFGSGRTNVGIHYKELANVADYANAAAIARDWDGSHQATGISSAYSELLLQQDDSVAFIYEESTYGSDYSIIYKKYSVEQITDGAYSLRSDLMGIKPKRFDRRGFRDTARHYDLQGRPASPSDSGIIVSNKGKKVFNKRKH